MYYNFFRTEDSVHIIRALKKKPRLPVNGCRGFMMRIGSNLKLREEHPGLPWYPRV